MIKKIFALWLLCIGMSVLAQDKFVTKGELVAAFPFQLKNGFLLVTLPVQDTNERGEKIIVRRSFLLDPAISNDGNFIPFDSAAIIVTSTHEFRIPVSESRSLKLDLVPTEAREAFRKLDPNFFGVIGYGFLKRYRSVIDMSKKEMRLYSLVSSISYSPLVDSNGLKTYYFDDVIINYCQCQFPSMWLELKAPPIKEGRVHLSLADNQSTIFRDALDPATLSIIEKEERADSLAGKQNFGGISVAQYFIGDRNIASRDPRRVVVKRPAKFKDLNVEVVGTLAMDVLRTYSAVIVDPTSFQIILVK